VAHKKAFHRHARGRPRLRDDDRAAVQPGFAASPAAPPLAAQPGAGGMADICQWMHGGRSAVAVTAAATAVGMGLLSANSSHA